MHALKLSAKFMPLPQLLPDYAHPARLSSSFHDIRGMLCLRHLRRASQLCLHPHSIASSFVFAPGLENPCIRRKGGTYTVGEATNIKWFEGAVSR